MSTQGKCSQGIKTVIIHATHQHRGQNQGHANVPRMCSSRRCCSADFEGVLPAPAAPTAGSAASSSFSACSSLSCACSKRCTAWQVLRPHTTRCQAAAIVTFTTSPVLQPPLLQVQMFRLHQLRSPQPLLLLLLPCPAPPAPACAVPAPQHAARHGGCC